MTYALWFLVIVFLFFIFYLVRIGAKGEHFSVAAGETIVVWLISNMPIGFLLWQALHSNNSEGWEHVLLKLINGGEIFIYVSAIVAPVVWALMAYFREAHRFFTGLNLIALFIILPLSAFAFQQAKQAASSPQDTLDLSFVLMYCVSMILWYSATVYTRFIESYEPSTSGGNKVLAGLQGGK